MLLAFNSSRVAPARGRQARLPSRLVTRGQPGPLAELVGDRLGGPAKVANHFGVNLMRFGAAALAQELAGCLKGPPGAVRQWRVEVDADVDGHAGGTQRGVGEPLGIQCPALAVPGTPENFAKRDRCLPATLVAPISRWWPGTPS